MFMSENSSKLTLFYRINEAGCYRNIRLESVIANCRKNVVFIYSMTLLK